MSISVSATDRVLIKIAGLDGSTADMVNPTRSDISKLYNFLREKIEVYRVKVVVWFEIYARCDFTQITL